MQEGNGLLRRDLLPGQKEGTVIADVLVKGLADFGYDTLFQEKAGHVRPCDDGAGIVRDKLIIGDGDACRAHHVAHSAVAGVPRIGEFFQRFGKIRIRNVHKKTNDVDVLILIFGGKLNAGNDFYIGSFGSFLCRRDAGNGIVIGQCKGGKAFAGGKRNQLLRGESAVGAGGMGVQINWFYGKHGDTSCASRKWKLLNRYQCIGFTAEFNR